MIYTAEPTDIANLYSINSIKFKKAVTFCNQLQFSLIESENNMMENQAFVHKTKNSRLITCIKKISIETTSGAFTKNLGDIVKDKEHVVQSPSPATAVVHLQVIACIA